MEIVGAVTSLLSCLSTWNPMHGSLARKCKLLWKSTRNLNKLEGLMEELEARKRDVLTELELMELGKGIEAIKPKEVVKLWMRKVEELKVTTLNLTSRTRQSSGCCHFSSRIKSGERIEDMIKDINDLLEKGKFSDGSIAEILPGGRGYILPATLFAELKTSDQALTRIWELLLDDSIRRVGVYGMAGVGKTTIMTQINNRLLKEGRFDSVMWTSVSKESNLDKLQKDIAMKVGLDLSTTEDENERAAKLLEALNRRKRFVLVLDDLWQSFSLEKVGIPTPTTENGCKLVITTRLLATCGYMETDEVVEVKVLSEDEAWSLFQYKALPTSPAMESIAKDVAKECGGLPLAIVTVGRALRYAQDISEWESALAQLRVSRSIVGDMDEAVISRLRLSFNRLKDDTYRSCFLLCALYPKDHLTDANELIEYWLFEGLLGPVSTATRHTKQKGRFILDQLRHACLLESVTENGIEYVKLHDLIRDMAITVMTTDPQWHSIVTPFAGLTNSAHIEWAEDVKRVSLMRNDLKWFPIHNLPLSPTLTSLLLQYNSFSGNLVDNMFDFMPALKVLDLSYTGIFCLPESLSNLMNLQALLLSNCWNLKAVPSLGKLRMLMVLDLSCCRNIEELPHGTQELRNLRRLNISNTSIAILPSGLLSSLRFLEELLASNCNVIWASDSIEELISSTSSLSDLEVDFFDLELYKRYARSHHWNDLGMFKFRVGQAEAQESFILERSIAFHGQIFGVLPPATEELKLHFLQISGAPSLHKSALWNLKIIDVDNCPKLKNLFSGKILLYLNNIQEIRVSHCESMEELMKYRDDNFVEFPNLTRLRLVDLPKLKSIYNGTIICNPLCSIEVISCDALKRLPLHLPSEPYFVEIKVTTSWWRSFKWDGENIGKRMEEHFVPLPVISDHHVGSSSQSELTTLFRHAKQLKKCTVVDCDGIECIIDPAQNNLFVLENLVLRFLKNLQMICRGMVTPSTLTNLKTIKVEYCPNLKNLFSSRLVLQLKNLEEIRVNHCDTMEDLIRWDEEGNYEDAKIHLPRLQKLRLELMPRLKSIYKGFISCSSLRSIEVITCDALRRLPLNPDDADGIPAAPALQIKGTNDWWQLLEWDEPAAKETMQAYFVQLPVVFDHVGSSSQAVPRISRDLAFEGRRHELGSTSHHTGDEYLSAMAPGAPTHRRSGKELLDYDDEIMEDHMNEPITSDDD